MEIEINTQCICHHAHFAIQNIAALTRIGSNEDKKKSILMNTNISTFDYTEIQQ